MFAQDKKDKLRKNDRVLVIKPLEGQETRSSKGLVDKRLFNGENKLHAILDTSSCNWSLKYEAGAIPGPLKQKFTKFNLLYDHVKTYMQKRGLDIVEVID